MGQVITVFELVPAPNVGDKLWWLLVGTAPYSNAPELALIQAFFQHGRESDERHRIVQHVQYKDNPRGVLLIIENIAGPAMATQHAYLCEGRADGGNLSMANQARPLLLPEMDLLLPELVNSRTLDLSRLPRRTKEFSNRLTTFHKQQMKVPICIKCKYRTATTWFASCGHMVACAECARSMQICGLTGCGQEIKQRLLVPVFLRTSQLFSFC